MADVDVQVQYTTTERKTRKVKKTSKRRESKDGEVSVTEVEQTNTTATNDDGYVQWWPSPRACDVTPVCLWQQCRLLFAFESLVMYTAYITMFYVRRYMLATRTYPT